MADSNYTSDEIQAVVEKLVLASIRAPIDTIGVRRTDITFSDVQQAAAGVFVLYPNSLFYVLYLGLQRLNDLLSSEAILLDQLLACIDAVGRDVLPVSDVSALFNARTALRELGAAAASRAGAVNVSKTPAYQRYTNNVDTFLAGPGQTVKANGGIVRTPQEARAAIPGLIKQLQESHLLLLSRVRSLVAGVDDYSSVNLPSTVISSVLANSATLLEQDALVLDSLSPEQRLEDIRQVVLNLLATKAVVRTFGSFSGPSDYYALDGLGAAYSDTTRTAEPATLTASKGGGYSLIAGDFLTFTVDGGTPFDVPLAPSFVASLDGVGSSPFKVLATGSDANNKVKVRVDNQVYTATLTAVKEVKVPTAAVLKGSQPLPTDYNGWAPFYGETLQILVNGTTVRIAQAGSMFGDAANFVSTLNQTLSQGADSVVASVVDNKLVLTNTFQGADGSLEIVSGTLLPLVGFSVGDRSVGEDVSTADRTAEQIASDLNQVLPPDVQAEGYFAPRRFFGQMTIPAGTDTTWSLQLAGSADFLALGVEVGDLARVGGRFYTITARTENTLTVSGTTTEQITTVEIGPSSRRVRIRCVNPEAQLLAETKLTVFGDDVASKNSLALLGFANGQSLSCTQTTAERVAADINSKTGVVTASTALVDIVSDAVVRADTSNPSRVVFSRASLQGAGQASGNTLTITVGTVTFSGAVSTGDVLVLRSGLASPPTFSVSTVNGAVATNKLLAVGDVLVVQAPVSLGAGSLLLSADIGPAFTAKKYQVLTVSSGPNSGEYVVAGKGATALDVLVQGVFPQVRARTSPTTDPFTFAATLSEKRLVLSSKNTTTASSLEVAGSAGTLFFDSLPAKAPGSSSWFRLPSIPRGLQPGDLLEFYTQTYQAPSQKYVIAQVVSSPSVIRVNPDASTGKYITAGVSWQFTPQPVPFAKLRVGVQNNFAQVRDALSTWLSREPNNEHYFTNLNRLINPLLVNSNPTTAQIGTAKNALSLLYSFLTTSQATLRNYPDAALESIVPTYQVEQVPPVDTLLSAFRAKGSDRAVDTLLQGQFSTFFSLTHETASYAGALQSALRGVAQNDLPVRKVGRSDVQRSRLKSQAESPDYEFTANQVDENVSGAQVDPPASYGAPSDYGTTIGR